MESVYKQDLTQVLSSYGGIFFHLLTGFPDCFIINCQGVLIINKVRTNCNSYHPDFFNPLVMGKKIVTCTSESLVKGEAIKMFRDIQDSSI